MQAAVVESYKVEKTMICEKDLGILVVLAEILAVLAETFAELEILVDSLHIEIFEMVFAVAVLVDRSSRLVLNTFELVVFGACLECVL